MIGHRGLPAAGRSSFRVAWRFSFLVLAVAGLLWLLDRIGWDRIGDHLDRLGWFGVILLLVLGVLEALVDAEAFRKALPVSVSRFYLFVVNQTGAFVNRFIPLETGEVFKGAMISRRVPMEGAVGGTIIWNYAFKLAKPSAAVISLTAALLLGDPSLRTVSLWMIPAVVLSFLPWVAMKILITVGIGQLVIRMVRLLRLPIRNPEELLDRARQMDRLVRQFRVEQPGAWRAVMTWQVLGRIFSWISYWIAMSLLDRAYDLATVGMIWTGFMVMGYLIAVLPSRLGTTEAGGYLLFDVLGLDPATGLTTQVILSLRAIAVNGLAALFLPFLDTSRRFPPEPGERHEGTDPAGQGQGRSPGVRQVPAGHQPEAHCQGPSQGAPMSRSGTQRPWSHHSPGEHWKP